MENSQEMTGILEIESLMIESQSISDDYMSCNEDFDIVAAAEMMHADDVRSFIETQMEQDTPYTAECICCVDNVHQEVPIDTPAKSPLPRQVTFEMNEISATSTQQSKGQPDKNESYSMSPVIRRSSRIESNTQKRKSSEMTPDVSLRKRKSNAGQGSTPKIRRTTSLSRASKSPANGKGSNQKVAKIRKSTGSTGRPRRKSGKFNKP